MSEANQKQELFERHLALELSRFKALKSIEDLKAGLEARSQLSPYDQGIELQAMYGSGNDKRIAVVAKRKSRK
jgi:hypothetical protein